MKKEIVVLNIKNIDVNHCLALPELGINEELIPEKKIAVEFVVDKKGSFTFFYNVYYGAGHNSVSRRLIVK